MLAAYLEQVNLGQGGKEEEKHSILCTGNILFYVLALLTVNNMSVLRVLLFCFEVI